jgi:hypothetical protein
LQLSGEPKASCRSPFREEKRASFSNFANGQLARDHATGERFDGPAFVAKALHLSIREALKTFVSMAGVESTLCPYESACAKQTDRRPKPIKRPDLSKLHVPTRQELRAIAIDRGLDPAAPEIAKRLGCLLVGNVCGRHSWILTDPRGVIAEGRRFGKLNYPACGELSERKAHAIKGSSKSWPLGLGIAKTLIEKATLILILEGGPDWLAAWDLIHAAKAWDVVPVSLLGRCIHGLHVDAMELLSGKAVRFVPHADADGGTLKQIELIGDQLRRVGCEISVYDLSGLPETAGKPLDLNDVIRTTERVRLAEFLLCNTSKKTNY